MPEMARALGTNLDIEQLPGREIMEESERTETAEGLGRFWRPVASEDLAKDSGNKSSNVRVSPVKTQAEYMIFAVLGVDNAEGMGQDAACREQGAAKQLQNPRGGWKREPRLLGD